MSLDQAEECPERQGLAGIPADEGVGVVGEEPGEVVVAEAGVELHRGREVAQERWHGLLLDAEEGEALGGLLELEDAVGAPGLVLALELEGKLAAVLAEKAQ